MLKESDSVGWAGYVRRVAASVVQGEGVSGVTTRIIQRCRRRSRLPIAQRAAELRGLRITKGVLQIATDRQLARARGFRNDLRVSPGPCGKEDYHEFQIRLHVGHLKEQQSCRLV